MTDPRPALADLLEKYRDRLLSFVEREGRGLLRKESGMDLVQGVHVRALQQERAFDYRGDDSFFAWLKLLAHQQIADRHDYWSAMRRRATRLMRITSSDDGTQGVQPAGKLTGPLTFAARREMMEVATKALVLLLPRDQELVQAVIDGKSSAEMGAALGISTGAAEQARHRAMQRYSKLIEMMAGDGKP